MEIDIGGKKLLKIFLLNLFSSDIIITLVNIIIPCILSIHCSKYIKGDKIWLSITILLLGIIFIYNIISVIIKKITDKQKQQLSIIFKCYNEQQLINSKFATNIYRLNKLINGYITDNVHINKKSLDNYADFQTFSFCVCESIYKILVEEFGTDILCEVTLMQRNNDIVKMIAYANENNKIPSSYKQEFNLKSSDAYFVEIFNDLNGEIHCLPNKEAVEKEFKKFKASYEREKNICQYIGIPVKTDRNKIEFLLQIDVSKADLLGKNEHQVKSFAKNVFYPYAMLLYKSYERDLIFNQYYDMIVAMLSKS